MSQVDHGHTEYYSRCCITRNRVKITMIASKVINAIHADNVKSTERMNPDLQPIIGSSLFKEKVNRIQVT